MDVLHVIIGGSMAVFISFGCGMLWNQAGKDVAQDAKN